MSLKHGLLGLLNYGSMTGYELHKVFEESLGSFWTATRSQVYRELDKMESIGFLSSERIMQEEKPNKRVYSITKAGQDEFIQWLAAPKEDIEHALRVRSAFLMRIFFAGETDKKVVISMLREYQTKCEESLSVMKHVPEAIEYYSTQIENKDKALYWKLTAMYGEEYYCTGIKWAQKAITLLEESI